MLRKQAQVRSIADAARNLRVRLLVLLLLNCPTFSIDGQTFVDGLMEKTANLNGDTSLIEQIPRLVDNPSRVIVRPHTLPFWEDCILCAIQTYRVCAVGSPGIGKSASIIILISLLLKRNRDDGNGETVVYHLRGHRWIYEFRRTGVAGSYSYVCEAHEETLFPYHIPSLQNQETFYVVDPRRSTTSCDPIDFPPRIIIVSSPNEEHWGGKHFAKEQTNYHDVGVFRYYPIWSLPELLNGRETLNENRGVTLTPAEVTARYAQVGGIPRRIFCPDAVFKTVYLRRQEDAVIALSRSNVEDIILRDADATVTKGDFDPKSDIVGLELRAVTDVSTLPNDNALPNDNTLPADNTQPADNVLSNVGYSEFQAVLLSSVVRKRLYAKYLLNVWADVCRQKTPGPVFEEYTWLLLIGDTKLEFQSRRIAKITIRVKPVDPVSLGGCLIAQWADNIVLAACRNPGILLLPNSPTYPFIDFVYCEENAGGVLTISAFQATVAESHSAKPKGIKGFVRDVAEATSSRQAGSVVIKVYYLVPPRRFKRFYLRPRIPKGSKIEFFIVQIVEPSVVFPFVKGSDSAAKKYTPLDIAKRRRPDTTDNVLDRLT
jgi:hypothetical protein